MAETSIEWTRRPGTVGASWNPIVGCNRVSPGCKHCYAEVMAARIANAAMARPEAERTPIQHAYIAAVRWRDGKAIPRWSGRVTLIPEKLWEPLRRKRPTTYFANSMSDLFHESLSDEQIAAVFGVMAACPQHTFQVLTKRPERAVGWFRWAGQGGMGRGLGGSRIAPQGWQDDGGLTLTARDWPPKNVWLGTSVEDQQTADERIPALLRYPAAVRFVSYEPALGPIYFGGERGAIGCYVPDTAKRRNADRWLGPFRRSVRKGIDWIIVGGESGPGARPFDVGWARSAVEQCRAAGVACFVKQLGADPGFTGAGGPGTHSPIRIGLDDPKGADPSEWPEDLRVREWPG